jgi:protein-S-isoprenylcysteine O-methyltransferase Ste14
MSGAALSMDEMLAQGSITLVASIVDGPEEYAFALLALAIAWMAYFTVHSVMAGTRFKSWLAHRSPSLGASYRLFYNLTASASLLIPLGLVVALSGPPLVELPNSVKWALDGLALVAVAAFVWSLKGYDLGRFAGTQRNEVPQHDGSALALSGFNRYVRHPWYALGLVIIWTRPLDGAWLVSAFIMTAYFFIGTRLEEHKLIERFGDAYRQYQARVPMFFPRPGAVLSPDEAHRLEALAPTSGADKIPSSS